MIKFVFIFFVFRWVSSLAVEFGKNTWLYGVLSILVYYIFCWVFGFVLKIIWLFGGFHYNSLTKMIVEVLFGLAAVWIFRSILKTTWKKEVLHASNSDLLDDASDF